MFQAKCAMASGISFRNIAVRRWALTETGAITMTRIALPATFLISAATLAAGCASVSAPAAAAHPPAISIAECSQIRAEITSTEKARQDALEKQRSAWKAVIPFAVAARHSAGKSAAAQADKRLGELYGELARRNCVSNA